MGPTVPELEALIRSVIDQHSKIDLLNQLAWDIRLDDSDRSRSLSEQAHALATSSEFAAEPYRLGLAGCLRNLAFLNNDAGNYTLSLTESLHALELLESASNDNSEAQSFKIDVFGNISWTYRGFGDYGVAADYGMKALKLAEEAGDRLRQARLLNSLGNVYAESNDLDASLSMAQRALQYYRELGLADGESVVLNNLALTFLEMGDGAKALETCRESLHLTQEHGIAAVEPTVRGSLGEIYLGIKDYSQAEIHLNQALTLARKRGARYDEFLNLMNLGKVYHAQQNDGSALSAFQAALAITQALNHRRGEFQCHQLLADVYERQGELQLAFEHFKQFHTLKETVFNEEAAKRLSGLQVIHQVETAKRDAEIHYIKTIELSKEIEERKTAQAALEEIASLDPLTGLLNRREFFMRGERGIQEALQRQEPLSVVLFDLDHFKGINDTHGHIVGDQVLVQTAKMVRESLRRGEIIGRFGGDEFVILLPGSNSAQSQQIAERLREKVASQVMTTPQGDLSLTFSLGIAELKMAESASLDVLVDRADQALYAAKRAGRNQLAVYPG